MPARLLIFSWPQLMVWLCLQAEPSVLVWSQEGRAVGRYRGTRLIAKVPKSCPSHPVHGWVEEGAGAFACAQGSSECYPSSVYQSHTYMAAELHHVFVFLLASGSHALLMELTLTK